jgi:sugar lactone lactonase YvrE
VTRDRAPLGSFVQDEYDVVAELGDDMPTGVTVSDDGRVFVSFPRWGDDVSFTVAEIVDGNAVAFPDAGVNEWSPGMSPDQLISVQSVVVDPDGFLWLLDTGAPSFAPYVPGGPKLVRIDLSRNEIDRIIHVDESAMTPTTYLNDVRFDFSRGDAGYAYVTDSQPTGALIVVDLATGESWDRLRGHDTTRAEDGFRAVVQGLVREEYRVGADGIAISPTGDRLFYCPLSSRRLYSVDTTALHDREVTDARVAESVLDHGDKGASDGLETDTAGNLYATAYEHSAVLRRAPTGEWTTVLHGPKLLWPDTLALAADGHLYVSINQLPRTPLFNHDVDDRIPPYLIIRVDVGAEPIRLTRGSESSRRNS